MQCCRRTLLLALQDRIGCDTRIGACLAAGRSLEEINNRGGRGQGLGLGPFRSNDSITSRASSNQGSTPTDNSAEKGNNEPSKYPNSRGKHEERTRKKRPAQLGLICRYYKTAVQRGDLGRAVELLDDYHVGGGDPQLWMFDMLINLHARRRDMPSALAVQDLMRSKGLQPSLYVYNSLVVACSRARPTGYNLPEAAVAAAEAVLRDMAARGVARDHTSHSIMMDVYAKAGMLAEAEGQMALLQAAGGQPGTREYAALLEACKRSNRAAHAAHILHTVMPAAGVLPDVRAWNALLGAYGRNGDIDGAYATWQEMMERRVVPSDVTERELAEAFSSSPTFATDVVQQCKSFRALLEAGAQPAQPGSSAPPGSGSLLVAAFHIQGWLNWLLHGAHHPAAPPPSDLPTAVVPAQPTEPPPRARTSGQEPPSHTATQTPQPNTLVSTHGVTSSTADVGGSGSGSTDTSGPGVAMAAGSTAAAVLDVHRMNQAQARAALLQQLHALSSTMPRVDVDAAHLEMVAGAVGYPLGSATDQRPSPALPHPAQELHRESDAEPREAAPPPEHTQRVRAEAGKDGEQTPGGDDGVAEAAVRQWLPRVQAGTKPQRRRADTSGRTPTGQDDVGGGVPVATFDGQKPSPMNTDERCATGSAATCTADSPAATSPAAGFTEAAPGGFDWGRGPEQGGGPGGGPGRAAGRGAATEGGGLVIIMGRGRSGASVARATSQSTPLDQNPLQLAVRDLLHSLHVGYEEVEDNPGRLLVPRAELLRFAARSNHRGEEHAMMRRMLFRALALSLAAASVVQLMSDATWAQLFIFVEDHF